MYNKQECVVKVMPYNIRLTQVYSSSKEIHFDNKSKFIFFSDCHRGDNSWSDDFAKNKDVFLKALEHYYRTGFTYIEIGDGDELWENSFFSLIRKAHADVFAVLKKFHDDGRLYMLNGNHDIYKRCRRFVENALHGYNSESSEYQPLLDNIVVYEGLILKHKETKGRLFVVHGHQGDLLNDYLWPIACLLTRYIWRRLETLGIKNLFSPAKFSPRKSAVEAGIINWIWNNKAAVIAGHTHHPSFPSTGGTPYFNTGSCIDTGGITGIEIQSGEIALVQWSKVSNDNNGFDTKKLLLSGPVKITSFFEHC